MKLLVSYLLFCSLAVLVSCNSAFRDKMFFLQRPSAGENEILLVVTWSEGNETEATRCEIFTDEELIQKILKLSQNHSIKKPSSEEMENLLEDCTEISLRKKRSAEEEIRRDGRQNGSNKSRSRSNRGNNSDERNSRIPIEESRSNSESEEDYDTETMTPPDKMEGPQKESSTTEGYDGLPVIFPGTKWCGAGDIAKNYDDLGLQQDTDRCCRAHDLCNDTLAPGETRNNLTNKSSFTKLSCKCDQDFYDCLNRVNTVTSNTIGNMYFNLLKRECYEKDYPRTSTCKKYRSFLKITCKEYARDANAPEVYQWMPAKKYKKIPIPGPLTVTLPF